MDTSRGWRHVGLVGYILRIVMNRRWERQRRREHAHIESYYYCRLGGLLWHACLREFVVLLLLLLRIAVVFVVAAGFVFQLLSLPSGT